MALDTNKTQSLMEAVTEVALKQNAPKEEVVENVETSDQVTSEDIALAYLADVLGDQLNESTEEDASQLIAETVQGLNIVCEAVNKYFGLID